jgi:hypothetical protein
MRNLAADYDKLAEGAALKSNSMLNDNRRSGGPKGKSMRLRLLTAVTAMTLLIPAYAMAAGTEMHEMRDSRPAGTTPTPETWSGNGVGPCWRSTPTGWVLICN